ncbi:hypothetical protein HZC21_03310 [Candidatus Peregrinibacteria bacterium]|nr:hypothetical protein [Candidatus Peregrinibacteria bacterium]
MFNFFSKFWRKKEEEASYKEAEKLILASNFTPMKPTDQFKSILKEKVLNRFGESGQTSPFFSRKLVFSSVFAVLIIAAIGFAFFFKGNLSLTPEIPVVRASEQSVPVNFPIRVKFSYSGISQENLQKYFSISPQTVGAVSFENGILTFDHPKFLKYKTEYTFKVSKDAGGGMDKDFEIKFTTRQSYRSDFWFAPGTDLAHYALNYYEPESEVVIDTGDPVQAKASLYKVSPEKLLDFIVSVYSYENDEEKAKLYAPLKENLIETQKVASVFDKEDNRGQKIVYKPGLKDAGIYFVEMEDFNFFITYSRYAVSSKKLNDKLIRWVVDTKTGEGIPGAKIAAYSQDKKTKKLLFEETTDDKGIHAWNIPQGQDAYQSYPVAETVEVGSERFVNILNMRQRSIFDGGGWCWQWACSGKYSGYIMTDRPLYSPGNRVQFKVMLRKKGEPEYDGSIKTAHVEIVRDQYGSPTSESIFKSDYEVSKMGTFAGDFDLSRELKTGNYDILVSVGDEHVALATFGVEVFQKPDFEVSVKTDKEKYISGQDVTVNVSAKYFFGTAVKNQKATISISSNTYYGIDAGMKEVVLDNSGNAAVKFEKLKIPEEAGKYWHSDEIPFVVKATVKENTGKSVSKNAAVTFYQSEYSVKLEEPKEIWKLRPREKTKFVFRVTRNLDLSEMNGVEGAKIELNIVNEKWNKTEFVREEIPVLENQILTTDSFGKAELEHAFALGGSYNLKYSVKDSKGNINLHENYLWIPDQKNGVIYDEMSAVGGTVQIGLVADKESYRVGETAKITAYLPQEEGAVFVSVNTGKMKKISVERITSNEKLFEIPVTEDLAPGFFIFAEAYNGDSFFSGSKSFEVTGKKLTVEITSSKKQFYPKESVKLSVLAKDEDGNPVASEGLISVIDKAILALKRFGTDKLFDAFYQVPDEYFLTRFSNVDPFIIGSAEKGGCFLAGTKILMSDGTFKSIEDIEAGDMILTRENEFSLRLTPDKVVRVSKHEVAEYLIINGFLRVTPIHRMFINGEWKTAGEAKTGDWFTDYKGNRVQISSMERHMSKVKVYNFATERLHTYFADGIYVHNQKGGEDSRPRSNFLDTAYWNAFVETGSNGRGEVSFNVPDNLTTWVALGKNITRDTLVGEGQGEFLVTKDLIIRPILPLFGRSGDELDLVATVHNNSNQSLPVKASIRVSGAIVKDDTEREFEVAANSVEKVIWKMKFSEAREAKFSFSVNQVGGNLVDNLEQTIPIYPSLTLNHQVLTGYSPNKIEFNFDKDKVSLFSNASVFLSSSVTAILPEVIEKLVGYPYGCVEQTMTKHLPNVLVKKYHELLGIKVPDDLDKSLEDGLERLQKFQHDDGSYGWWEDDEANIWMTGYVMEGFIEMKEMNSLGGREAMHERTLNYLVEQYPKLQKLNEKSYIAYVLSRALPGKHKLEIKEDDLKTLSPQFLGYVALANHFNGNESEAKRIRDEFIMKSFANNHWKQESDYNSMSDEYSATGTNLYVLLTMGAKESEIKGIVQWLMNNRGGYEGLWGSTRQSAQILFALLKYIQTYDELNPDLKYELILNGEQLVKGAASSSKFSKEIELPLGKLKNKNTFEFAQEGKGNIYYTVHLKNYADASGIEKPADGLIVTRTYLLDGKPADKLHVGDVLTVKIDVESPDNMNYVMVEDSLASGFDVINDRLKEPEDEWGWYGYWGDPIDIRDERVVMFRDYLSAGRNEFSYRVRVARDGIYSAPAPRAEPMYNPQMFGVGSEEKVKVF